MHWAVALCCGFAGFVLADVSGTWTAPAGGFWSDTNNWQNGVVPFGTGQMATFSVAGVSVTNDGALPVGVLKFNQANIAVYGDPVVLDATEPKLIANSGTAYLHVPVVATNALTVTREGYAASSIQISQRSELESGRVQVTSGARLTSDARALDPLPGDAGTIRAPLSVLNPDLTLSWGGVFHLLGSAAMPTEQRFGLLNVRSRGVLDVVSGGTAAPATVRADDLVGSGMLSLAGGGCLAVASASRFTGVIQNPGADLRIDGTATPALKPAADPIMHLDASDPDSFTFEEENGTNFVVEWFSQVPGNYVRHDGYLTDGQRALPWVRTNALNGLPVVDLGNMIRTNLDARSLAPYLIWNTRSTAVKAAFAVLRTQNFIFTDTSEGHYHNHVLTSGGVFRWDQIMLLNRGETAASFKNGEYVITLNGAPVANPFAQPLSATEFDVVAMVVKEGATTVGTLARDRSYRFGGQQVAEEIFYDRVLTDAEIEATVAYLRQKWQGVAGDAGLAAAGPGALRMHVADSNRTRLTLDAGAALGVEALSGSGIREVSGNGTLRVERGGMRPSRPLALQGGTLELVNRGRALDATLETVSLITNLYFHLDASDLSSMTLDGDRVLEWRGNSNVTNGLLAYAINTEDNPAPWLVRGRLNGLPVVDFGAWGGGALLHWNHTNTAIRTLFMVFDHIHPESFWLSDIYDGNYANFHRGDNGLIFNTSYVTAGLKTGQVSLNGNRIDQMATVVPEEEPFLISFLSADGTAARAACMATDRYPRPGLPKYRSGGQRIAEVLVFNRHLNASEREQVEGYLMRKWLPHVPARFAASDGSQTFDGVFTSSTEPVAVKVGAGQQAVLGALDGSGPVEKTGAGTLVVGQVAGLTAPLSVKEGRLAFDARVLADPYVLPGGVAYHVDASAAASILLDADGVSVTNILDASGGGLCARPADPEIPPLLLPHALNGLPVLSFREANSGCAALWSAKVSGIRSVFWVIGSQEGGGMPLGTGSGADGSDFKRTPIVPGSSPIWGSESLAQYGVTRISGAVVDGRATGFNGGYQLMSLVTDRGCSASAFATHKNEELFGGQRLAEVIVYPRLLSDAERRDVEAYLARKWFGAPTSGYAGGKVEINDLSAEGGTVDLPTDTEVSIRRYAGAADVRKTGDGVLSISDLSALSGAVVVSNGTFILAGKPAQAGLPENGMLMHMDASVTGSFEVVSENGTNFVSRWNSLVGSAYAAHDGVSKRPWLRDNELGGSPVVDFGPFKRSGWGDTAADGAYLIWDQPRVNIRSGFMVLGSQDGGNFLVGWNGANNIADFHRGYGVEGYVTASGSLIATSRTEPPLWIKNANAYWSVDGVRVNQGTTGLSGGYQAVCFMSDPEHAPTNTLHGSGFAIDRTYRWGGQRLAEFAVYDRILTDEERLAVEVYLRNKWFGVLPEGYYQDGSVSNLAVFADGVVDVQGQTRPVAHLNGDGTLSNGTLIVTGTLAAGPAEGQVGNLTADGLTLGDGVVMRVDLAGGVCDRVSLGGALTFQGTGTVVLSHTGTRVGDVVGEYTLFSAGAIQAAELAAGWAVEGLPPGTGGKLTVSGTNVMLTVFAQGTMLLMR
jgi:hypothetical protein